MHPLQKFCYLSFTFTRNLAELYSIVNIYQIRIHHVFSLSLPNMIALYSIIILIFSWMVNIFTWVFNGKELRPQNCLLQIILGKTNEDVMMSHPTFMSFEYIKLGFIVLLLPFSNVLSNLYYFNENTIELVFVVVWYQRMLKYLSRKRLKCYGLLNPNFKSLNPFPVIVFVQILYHII